MDNKEGILGREEKIKAVRLDNLTALILKIIIISSE